MLPTCQKSVTSLVCYVDYDMFKHRYADVATVLVTHVEGYADFMSILLFNMDSLW